MRTLTERKGKFNKRAPQEKFINLKVPPEVLERARAVKEADRLIMGRSTTLLDIVNFGIKHLEDEHWRLRSGLIEQPNGSGHSTTRAQKHHEHRRATVNSRRHRSK